MKNFKYALFEVTIVFIGVSSAFFLNNWTNQKERTLKEIYYTDKIIEDLSYNINELQERIEMDTTNISRSYPLIEELYLKTLPEDSIVSVLHLMATFGRINLKFTTYEEIITNGDFNILSNDSIRSMFIETKMVYEEIIISEKFYEDFVHNFILPYVMNNFDLMSDKAINNSIVQDFKLLNHFGQNTSFKEQLVEEYEKLYDNLIEFRRLLISSKEELVNTN
ncbi:MAG TPA: hypothetical protein EYQ21_06205 [Flavobacteriales bacterium]|nr:hypothetical protein [Flavobacteriales bacterium]